MTSYQTCATPWAIELTPLFYIANKEPRSNIWSHITQPLSSFFPVQPAYENYSFEELRYASPALQRQSETMLVRPNNDGTYTVTRLFTIVEILKILIQNFN